MASDGKSSAIVLPILAFLQFVLNCSSKMVSVFISLLVSGLLQVRETAGHREAWPVAEDQWPKSWAQLETFSSLNNGSNETFCCSEDFKFWDQQMFDKSQAQIFPNVTDEKKFETQFRVPDWVWNRNRDRDSNWESGRGFSESKKKYHRGSPKRRKTVRKRSVAHVVKNDTNAVES